MKLSFLTSSMNRCHHLKQTYLENIENSSPTNRCEVEFVLLNYNSADDMDKWAEELKPKLEDFSVSFRYLKTDKPKYFSMSHTKNILGKNASGDILCWLDADNITTPGFVRYIERVYHMQTPIALKVDWSVHSAGTCGRIVCRKKDFLAIGGYDEQMRGWAYEEIDFRKRLEASGVVLKDIPAEFLVKLNHDDIDRFANYEPNLIKELPSNHPRVQMQYSTNVENYNLHMKNMSEGRIIANVEKTWAEL